MSKEAQVPIAAQLAAAILGVGVLENDRQHVAQLEEEAELMNEELRGLEARKMDQTISALKHAEVELGLVVKAAAMEAALLMNKMSAGGLGLVGAAVRRSIGGAAQAAGRLMPAGSKAQKSWVGLGTKAKVLGGAAALGTGYAGFKGLQATRDYMQSQPHGTYGGKSPAVMHNVNEFGHPEY